MSEIDEIVTQNALRNVDELPSLSVQDYIQRATTDNTRKAYQQDIRHFQSWGGKLPTDTATVIRYCHAHAESHNSRTLQRRLVALKQFHTYQGFADPTSHPAVRKALRGIQNTHGKPKRKAQALQLEQLTAIPAVAQSPYIPRGLEIIFRKLFLLDPSVFEGSRGFSAGAPADR